MGDTPRTDLIAHDWPSLAMHARQLERELAVMKEQRDAAVVLIQECDPTADDDNGWAQRYLGLLHEIEKELK